MKSLALALAFALAAPDGGTPAPFSDAVYDACPVTEDKAELRDAGFVLPSPAWVMSELRASRTACLMATCASALHREKDIVEEPPHWWVASAIFAVLSVALGVTIGIVYERYRPK